MQWRLATPGDQINVTELWKGKQLGPESLGAERLLLGNFYGFGASVNKFAIYGDVRLIDRKTGKKLWSADGAVMLASHQKLTKLPSAEQQQALKEGTNQVIEFYAKKRAEQLKAQKVNVP